MPALIFGELDTLKGYILPGELSTRDDWDTQITGIADGVARSFDRYCNRTFIRDTAAIDYFSADRPFVSLKNYPIESITEIAEKTSYDGTFTAVENIISSLDEEAGLAYCNSNFGTRDTRLRVTYSGGFWVDTSDAQNGSLPSGATAMPEDILEAWRLQVSHELTLRDVLGVAAATQQANSQIKEIALLPRVKEILGKYIRYQC